MRDLASYGVVENVEVGMSVRKISAAQLRQVLISLDMLLEKLQRHFIGRASAQEVELLTFNLRYLFYAIDTLYGLCLPNLLPDTPVQAWSPEDARYIRYSIWQQFQEVERLLERVEPLCCLLSNVIVSLLEAINRTCLMPTRVTASIEMQGTEQLDEQLYFHMIEEEQWQQAMVQFNVYLQLWHSTQRASFVSQFAQQPSTLPLLKQIDIAFEQIAVSCVISFGEILPGFQSSTLNDEAIIMLLLDLQQGIDQVLFQLPTLHAPLHTLVKSYAVIAF
jgi:hypothetical protein